ncbi:MAG: cell wall hydrolase [Holosporales bacterium]|jgi:spore germination cell wall hydrolase CwlJ-like protein|nr:cell wall hydrolase [Holosporales bacterium]
MNPTRKSIEIMAKTIYGEARGEYFLKTGGLPSLIAVANVIMNRCIATNEEFVENVCLKPKQFSCWNEYDPNFRIISRELSSLPAPIKVCETVAKEVVSGRWPDITKEATHYYNKNMQPPPYWATNGDVRIIIGNHVFMKLS